MIDALIPFRGIDKHRIAIHQYTQQLWSDLVTRTGAVTVHVADDQQAGTKFNLAKAVNQAFRSGNGEHVIIFGSGHLPPSPTELDTINDLLEAHPWIACYNTVRELSKDDTRRTLQGDAAPHTLPAVRTTKQCTGILAMHRETFREAGGMDERFNGWGYEDTALRDILTRLYGKPPPPPGKALTTLWHPPSDRTNLDINRRLFHQQRSQAKNVAAYLDKRGRYA